MRSPRFIRVNRSRLGVLAVVGFVIFPFAMAPDDRPETLTLGGGGHEIIEERDETDAVVRQVVYGLGRPLWQIRSDGSSQHFLEDPRGNTAALAEGASTPTEPLERVTYDPFGRPVIEDSSNEPVRDRSGNFARRSQYGNANLFTGAWYDPELGERTGNANTDRAGLYRFGPVAYNPDEGRFVTRPVKFPIENGTQVRDVASARPTGRRTHRPVSVTADVATRHRGFYIVDRTQSTGAQSSSTGNRRYLYFAKVADVEGHPDIAGMFRDTADGEASHAHGHLDYLKQVGDPATAAAIAIPNLLDARKSANESSANAGHRPGLTGGGEIWDALPGAGPGGIAGVVPQTLDCEESKDGSQMCCSPGICVCTGFEACNWLIAACIGGGHTYEGDSDAGACTN